MKLTCILHLQHVACVRNIIEDNQKQYILEVTIIIALFGFDQSEFVEKNILIFSKKRENNQR